MRESGRMSCARATWIALVLLAACLVVPAVGADEPEAVATFESIGLAWSPGGGGPEAVATVRYRPLGSSTWSVGHPLWFDARSSPSPPFHPGGEYRGSLVLLAPGTTYEIELTAEGGAQTVLTADTWSEDFPIGDTVLLPESSSDTLVIDQSGSPEGYVLYAPAPGQTATIDVANARDSNIVVKASYVIIRGLILKGAREDAINIQAGANTNIVVEGNDISGWGRVDPAGFGINFYAAVRAKNPGVERLIVQRNRIHHPRADTNSWCEHRDGNTDPTCKTHPEGPHAIRLTNTGGHHVIRYNTIDSDDAHYFADAIGGGAFNYTGFPNRDADIYGNYIERCWDNPIEAEGGNRNTRIWGNYIDRSYSSIGIVPHSVGPLYIWRNVIDRSRIAPEGFIGNRAPGGRFIKAGSGNQWAGGRAYIYHNTLLQRPPESESQQPLGVRTGIGTNATGGKAYGLVSRNNILQVASTEGYSIKDNSVGCGIQVNDFNTDLYNGLIESSLPQESAGIGETPIYALDNGSLEFFLDASSPGYDQGVVLWNFNDGFAGAGPDIGAYDDGFPTLEFGVDAYTGTPAPR